ncbi:MAG: hypothetical protein IPI85_11355 [Dehalococcoidia bacterium]|nr:hypothetical protein [Dehalococcoidia bacterium]
MKRAILLGFGAIAVAAAAVPALVSAADFPPPPPTTYYGKGADRHRPGRYGDCDCARRFFRDGLWRRRNRQRHERDRLCRRCRGGMPRRAAADSQTVQFYFVGEAPSTDTANWSGPGPAQKDLTGLGAALTPKNRAPAVAKDGLN